jgi:myo-inositol catabolism protein IolS
VEYRTLRHSDLTISSIVLGTAFRGGLVDTMPDVITRALDLGINIFDTGGYVRNGVPTEAILGNVIKDKRQDIILAVKQDPPLTQDLKIRLKRLQTDYIDILEILPCRCHAECDSGYEGYANAPHYSVGDAMRLAEKLVDQGVVRYIGVSRYTTAQLEEAEAALTQSHLVLDQLHYNLASRAVGAEAMPYCKAHDITILAYSPLGAGLFWGDATTISKERCGRYGFDRLSKLELFKRLLETLGELGDQRQKTVAQVAMNWLLCQGNVVPITGPDTVAHLEENCGAVDWRLHAAEVARIDAAVQGLDD